MVQNIEVIWQETATGKRRVASEAYPLPVTATFAGSISVGNVEGDAAHDAADTGDPIKMGFKAEATTPAAVADGDRSNLFGTLYGAAFTNLRRASDGAEIGAGGVGLQAVGDVAHGATDAGFPVKIGGRYKTLATGFVTLGQRTDAMFDEYGRMGVITYDRTDNRGAISLSANVDEVATGVTGEGSQAYIRCTPTGDMRVCLTDSTGANVGTNANPVIVSSPSAGPLPVNMFGQVDEVAPGNVSAGEGNYYVARIDQYRDLRVCLTKSADGADLGVAGAGLAAQGDVAHDAVDSGNPVKVGGKAYSSVPTAVANADRVDATYTLNGAAHVQPTWQSRSDTFTATGNGTTIDASSSPKAWFTIQATATGAVTSWTIVLEGSLDNTNFTTLLTHTNADPGTGGAKFSTAGTPFLYFRSRCTAITLGGGTNVIATILGEA